MDRIIIENLEVFAYHGVFPEETMLGQKFIVSCVLFLDTGPAGTNDDIEKTVDYGAAAHLIKNHMEKHTYKLIESAAEHLAQELLKFHDNVRQVELEIKKPWAPIGLSLDYAAVRICRKWHEVYIGLGSNLGDRTGYIRHAVNSLAEMKKCRVEKLSELIETEPYGGVEQDRFMNGVLKMSTIFTPRQLLEKLHELENEAGRERNVRWGPRTLDLDILFYDDEILEENDLYIPHIDLINREFVLGPMTEIAPYKKHPVYGRTMKELLESLYEKR